MTKEKTVFDVEMSVRMRKWYDIGTKNQVVMNRNDYEWLKDEAAKVVGIRRDLERLRDENRQLQKDLFYIGDEKKKTQNKYKRQWNRNKMLIRILQEHDLYDEFLAQVEEMRERSQQLEAAKLVDV